MIDLANFLLLVATAAFLIDAWYTRKWLKAAREAVDHTRKVSEQLLELARERHEGQRSGSSNEHS